MTDIDTLKQQYFVQSSDASESADNEITTFVDGKNYFDDLHQKIKNLGSNPSEEFCYVHAWGLERNFEIDNSGTKLVDLLKDKAKNDVDVRVMGWFSSTLFLKFSGTGGRLDDFRRINAETAKTIKELRSEPKLKKKCCLNTMGHAAGAAHAKLALVGDDTETVAYTGGIDPMTSRWAKQGHAQNNWHDVQVRIDGPAVRDVFEYYTALWNEVINTAQQKIKIRGNQINVHEKNAPEITTDPDSISVSSPDKHHVLSVRTVPVKTILTPALSFAPSGTFDVAGAWEKAISSATDYIYMENYTFKSPDILTWIANRVQNESDLKVILLIGGVGNYDEWAIENHLLDPLGSSEKDRVGIFERTDSTSGGDSVYVHSKVSLVDDQWFFVGSPNCSPRSLYTDIEHAIGVLDENEALATEVRKDLWREHFGMSSGSQLDDLDKALHVWDSNWGSAGVSPGSLNVSSIMSTFGSPQSLSSQERKKFDHLLAPDSRQWSWFEVYKEWVL